ncbi:MAG TPA: response regulator [Acidobacteriaceae bacterium]|jgi:CheY-like chemotaxis protein
MTGNAKLRLLMLDDDAVMRELLGALLAADGDEVTTAETLEDALRVLADDAAPDAILTDLHLPDIDTRTLLTRLREHCGGTPLLGMSASPPQQDVLALIDGFLMKPFEMEAVHDAVRQARNQPGATLAEGSASHAGTETPVLDREVYEKFAASFPAGQVGELYRFTLADVEKRLDAIRLAVAHGDFETCRSEAHAIKGGCGMVGALELRSLAATIETGATTDTSTLAEMAEACERLRRMLVTLEPFS